MSASVTDRRTQIEIRNLLASLVYETWRYAKSTLFKATYRKKSSFIYINIYLWHKSIITLIKSFTGATLRQTPKDRLTVDQMLESEWMKDAPRSEVVCEPWSMLPTTTAELVTDIERVGRERLAAIGITAEMLEEQAFQGARSSVIATYRIVVHRLQNNAQLPPIAPPAKVTKSRTCIVL